MHLRRRTIVVLIVAVVVVVALTVRLTPLWPGPAIPAGATALHIETAPPHLIPTMGCPAAALAPARIEVDGDALILVSLDGGAPISVVWPSGWAAWRRDGTAELVDRDGNVVGRQGDVIDGYGGGTGLDGKFHVCLILS